MVATTRNYTFHTQGWYACLIILPTSHSELPYVSSEVVCVSLLSCRLTGMAGQCWTPKRLILNNDFQTHEVDILVFMLKILRCKGVQVVLVPPSCLTLLLDAGEKGSILHHITIFQSRSIRIYPDHPAVSPNTGKSPYFSRRTDHHL